MYVPAHFAADDGLVSELLTRHGAADLVTNTSQGLLATMLPFIHDPAAGEHGALLGHLARNNDQWKVWLQGDGPAPDDRPGRGDILSHQRIPSLPAPAQPGSLPPGGRTDGRTAR